MGQIPSECARGAESFSLLPLYFGTLWEMWIWLLKNLKRTIHQVCFLMYIFFKRFNTIHLKFLNAISNWKNRVKFSFRLDPKWSHSNVSSVHYLFRMCVLSVCGPIRCCPFALLHIIVISVYYLFLALQQYLCLLGLSGGSINVIKRAKSQRLVA